MALVTIQIDDTKQSHEITTIPGKCVVILHEQGIRVDAPSFIEINPHQTINCVQSLNQQQWQWISQRGVFPVLYHIAFEGRACMDIPKNIDNLRAADMGVQHVCGLTILACEALFAGKNIFLRNPETYLHPAVLINLMGYIEAVIRMCGKSGKATATMVEEEDGEKWHNEYIKKMIEKAIKPSDIIKINPSKKKLTIQWLRSMGEIKGLATPFARIGDVIITISELIDHVERGTSAGEQVIERYFDHFRPKSD